MFFFPVLNVLSYIFLSLSITHIPLFPKKQTGKNSFERFSSVGGAGRGDRTRNKRRSQISDCSCSTIYRGRERRLYEYCFPFARQPSDLTDVGLSVLNLTASSVSCSTAN